MFRGFALICGSAVASLLMAVAGFATVWAATPLKLPALALFGPVFGFVSAGLLLVSWLNYHRLHLAAETASPPPAE